MSVLYEIGAAKITMAAQSHPSLSWCQTYAEARCWDYPDAQFPILGFAPLVKKYFSKPITMAEIEDVHRLFGYSELFPREMFEYIVKKHDGYLPVKLTGKKEGLMAKAGEVVYTIESTDPKCATLPVLLEQVVLRNIWHSCTFGWKTYHLWKELKRFSDITASHNVYKHSVTICGLDMASEANEANYGYAYMFFKCDPDIRGARFLNEYYGAKLTSTPILIQEHNFILTWGGVNGEFDALKKLICDNPDQRVGIQIDTYDAERVLGEYLPALRDDILKRTAPVIISLDNSDLDINLFYLTNRLASLFGVVTNCKGYKVINAPIRISQGDEIAIEQLLKIVDGLMFEGWSAENFFFMMTDDTVQKNLGRGTLGFIQKTCAIKHELYKLISVSKSPLTEERKSTKKGWQSVSNSMVYYCNGKSKTEKFSVVDGRLNLTCRNVR